MSSRIRILDCFEVVLPGRVLVVERAGLQTAVQDPDEPVRELPQGGMVADLPGAQTVVVGARAGRAGERREGLLVQGVAEPVIGGVAGEHYGLLAGRSSDRALTGVV